MLILTRCINESIRIGDDIEVVVMSIERGQVRLGIAAPKHVRVDRAEVRAKIDAEMAATR
jgi:carbon storage regulator